MIHTSTPTSITTVHFLEKIEVHMSDTSIYLLNLFVNIVDI